MKYFEVGPTIADDIKQAAIWAILGALIVVFLYILLRFRKWQYSLGAVVAVFHDVLIVLAIFSLFWKVLPFDMEIGQSFIAALLTVVGYSLIYVCHDYWSLSRYLLIVVHCITNNV